MAAEDAKKSLLPLVLGRSLTEQIRSPRKARSYTKVGVLHLPAVDTRNIRNTGLDGYRCPRRDASFPLSANYFPFHL
jgi:hypothetical protein